MLKNSNIGNDIYCFLENTGQYLPKLKKAKHVKPPFGDFDKHAPNTVRD